MTTREQIVSESLDRLFRTYPSSNQGETVGEILRNRIERVKVYLEAISQYETQDIEVAVSNFLAGSAPGHNPAFAPPAPQLAAEVRRVMNLRAERSALLKRVNALPPPQIEHSPESRERIRRMAQGAIQRLEASITPEQREREKRLKESWGKVNEMFQPDMSEEGIARRLGYSVGNDAEDFAA